MTIDEGKPLSPKLMIAAIKISARATTIQV
jgi:hypothetical protein